MKRILGNGYDGKVESGMYLIIEEKGKYQVKTPFVKLSWARKFYDKLDTERTLWDTSNTELLEYHSDLKIYK